MGKFGNTLKYYRERHNITKLSLAKGIGTSDAYIRQIENQNYKPPTFDVCEKISVFLSLSKNEKLNLYEAAFLERIDSEKEFYEILKNTIFVKTKNKPCEELSNHIITWHIRKMVYKRLQKIDSEVCHIIKVYANKNQIEVSKVCIYDTLIQLEVKEASIEKIQSAMPNLMKLTSGKIKSEFQGFSAIPNIWKNNFEISKATAENSLSETSHLIATKGQ